MNWSDWMPGKRESYGTLMLASALLLLVPACADAQDANAGRAGAEIRGAGSLACTVADAGRQLPEAVRETSGLARGVADTTLFWTHNDSGGRPEIHALDAGGRVAKTIRVSGAAVEDWEDIEAGPCEGGTCLYIADIGDNEAARPSIDIYRISEPTGNATDAAAVRMTFQYPDGARDAESLFVLPSQAIYLVTKGRHGIISLYRVPDASVGSTKLVKVRDLYPRPGDELDRVTAATASPDGRWVGIRTYRNLYVYDAAALVSGAATEPMRVDLSPLKEVQGESVAIANDGRVWMTSEAEDARYLPTWSRMKCELPAR